ncbi:hypothetical protein GmHk_08G023912 [Glycine max]|nr:hypothetical protein GmHk_08G023912 [Glycine max]
MGMIKSLCLISKVPFLWNFFVFDLYEEMIHSELDSENIDFTVIDDVGSESLGPGIRRELSFSRWCDDDGRIHLDQQLGNEDVSVEDDSDFELPFPEKT